MNNQFDTLSQATDDLRKRGYTQQFNLEPNRIYCPDLDRSFGPDDFAVDEYHRFEGMTNPGDMSVVYAITTSDNTKGTLIDAYGTYSDKASAEMVKKMSLKED